MWALHFFSGLAHLPEILTVVLFGEPFAFVIQEAPVLAMWQSKRNEVGKLLLCILLVHLI